MGADKDPKKHCLPEKGELSGCEDLMEHMVLRVFMWLLGIIALVGNVAVVLRRWLKEERNRVHALMIANLAVADGFMGLYMVIIAGADAFFRGKYFEHEEWWKRHWLCQFAGVIATLSSEVSVFTLLLITLDRFICIVYPLRFRRISISTARKMIGAVWIFVLILCVIPVIPSSYFHGKFYGRSGVCLPIQLTQGKPSGWEYSTAIFIVVNLISCLLILLGYVIMYVTVRRTSRASIGRRNERQQKREMALARRMTLIVSTDLICWLPIILTGILALLTDLPIPGIIYAISAVFFLPVNSAINPILYTFSTVNMSRSSNSEVGNSAVGHEKTAHAAGRADNLVLKTLDTPFIASTGSLDSCLGMSKELAANKIVTLDAPNVMNLTQCLQASWEFKPTEIMTIFRDLAQALAYLHKSGVFHGAVCTDNVLIYKYIGGKGVSAYLAGAKCLEEISGIHGDWQTADDVRDLANVIEMVLQQRERVAKK